MGRKRGGLAGIWDRNKRIIKPIATGLAGFFGTPALGALVGAAMGGLDREGKSGIGFDAKQGALGGLQGYAMGSLGSAASGTALGQKLGGNALDKFGGSGLRGLLGKGAPAAPTAGASGVGVGTNVGPSSIGQVGGGVGSGVGVDAGLLADTPSTFGIQNTMGAPTGLGAGGMHVPATTPGVGNLVAKGKPTSFLGKLGKLGSSVEEHPTAYAMGLQGLGSLATAGSANRQADTESRLTQAQAGKLEYENSRTKASDETLKELRARLAQQMMALTGSPNTAVTPYAGYRP